MGAICSTIGGWLKVGCDIAVSCFKWIWEMVSSLFSKACAALRDIFASFGACFSYRRERSYAQTESTRVEVGHDHLQVRVEIGNNQASPPQSNSSERKAESDKKVKEIEAIQTSMNSCLDRLKQIAAEDGDHQNNQETTGKLAELLESKDGRVLQTLLENQPTVNESLG